MESQCLETLYHDLFIKSCLEIQDTLLNTSATVLKAPELKILNYIKPSGTLLRDFVFTMPRDFRYIA